MCVLVLASVAFAKEPKSYQRAKLLQMDSVECRAEAKDGSLASEMESTDSSHKKTKKVLCQEYVLQTEDVNYHIRPRDEKHPVLLPVGELVQFRLQKDRMVVRAEDLDGKEREYSVVSILPRSENSTADAATHLNHLQ